MAELYMAEFYNMTLEKYSSSNYSDPEHIVLDRHTTMRFVVDFYVVGTLCLFGIVGNLITVVVLWSDNDRNNPTTWLLRCLACVDIFYLINCFCFQPLKSLVGLPNFSFLCYYPVVDFIVRPFSSIAQSMAVWVVLLLTIDRYVAACRPHSRHLRSVHRVKWATATGVLVSIIYNIPLFFEIVIVVEPQTGLMFSAFTDLRTNFYYFIFYKTICFLVFRTILPLIIVFVLNACLINTLAKRHNLRRKRMNAASTRFREHFDRGGGGGGDDSRDKTIIAKTLERLKQRKNYSMTSMLVVVISMFLVCHVPDSILRTLAILNQVEIFNELDALLSLNTFGNAMLALNSSMNFLIYCLLGRKFRRILSQMCCKKPNHETTTTLSSSLRCCWNKKHAHRNVSKTIEKSQNGIFDEDCTGQHAYLK